MSLHIIRPEPATSQTSFTQRKILAAAVGAVACAAIVISLLISKGAELHKAAEIQRAADIANENRTTCEKWGMRETTAAYAACSADLNDIRAKHEMRISADMNGSYR